MLKRWKLAEGAEWYFTVTSLGHLEEIVIFSRQDTVIRKW